MGIPSPRARRGQGAGLKSRHPFSSGVQRDMPDIAFLALTVAGFLVLGTVVKAVEKI